ncbi:MAG: methyltransferase domain-containing protein [Roseinatronobacter sp.]
MTCRHCGAPLGDVFVDLVSAPPSNAFLRPTDLTRPEPWYPLKVHVCRSCFLVQLPVHAPATEIFDSDYVYFSSYSTSWLAHAAEYVAMITERLALGESARVVEIASNDGYLLRNFRDRNIPCLGIEPSANTAEVARAAGIETWVDFFSEDLARKLVAERGQADLIIGNNVLAHVPDINDFVAGLAVALAPSGTVTLEFPHLLELIGQTQFDTIYHEHFSYLSLLTVRRICAAARLRVHDVEQLPTHGGSLRVYLCHAEAPIPESESVRVLLAKEHAAQLDRIEGYSGFSAKVADLRDALVGFLLQARRDGAEVIAYGAAAKGNTLLNFCGIRGSYLVSCVVDRSPHKIGKFLPGCRIPVVDEAEIRIRRPAYILILPWNLTPEIMAQLDYIADWGGQFVRAVPRLEILAPSPTR